MRGPGDERSPVPHARVVASPLWHAMAAVAGASLLCVVVVWGALAGPDAVFTGPGPVVSTVTTTPAEVTEEPEQGDAGPGQQADERRQPPLWLQLLTWTVVGIAVIVVAVATRFFVRVTRDMWDPRWRTEPVAPIEVELDVLGEARRVATAIAGDTAEQDRLLGLGTPRNGIVAVWSRLEQQAELAGLRREPWQTPSEFALHVLDVAGADQGAVQRLAAAYLEARFSEHEVGESHRQQALDDLRLVRRSLGGAQ